MPEWVQALIMFSAGITMGLICFIAGSWITYRVRREPGSGGFLKDPKGEVFNIPDGIGALPPVDGEPGEDEKNVLERTNRFLKVLGDKV